MSLSILRLSAYLAWFKADAFLHCERISLHFFKWAALYAAMSPSLFCVCMCVRTLDVILPTCLYIKGLGQVGGVWGESNDYLMLCSTPYHLRACNNGRNSHQVKGAEVDT